MTDEIKALTKILKELDKLSTFQGVLLFALVVKLGFKPQELVDLMSDKKTMTDVSNLFIDAMSNSSESIEHLIK